ncbi:class I SAM-dependent methyltransferase [Rhodopirellula sp. P2]|uniref:class I SAM-dependent methyltransferase n=1 Tax=Rhodopirellula sp. P2 TaxID=2127060 RepID=UPI002367EE09|nr:methyltransferase domain-containing protein [Rhodopirellula sp. P2]WDQ15505.1 methyltransferase domain-containing protein [Rhodopirellula sp. P2]
MRFTFLHALGVLVGLAAITTGKGVADDLVAADGPKTVARQTEKPRPKEEARRTYMGRIVAQPMSHRGAAWLVRPERDDEEKAGESFDRLGLEPGMTVVDLGCGNGYWTIPMARAVAAQPQPPSSDGAAAAEPEEQSADAGSETESLEGQVLAVDIQREMLQMLQRNAARAKLDNIQPVLGAIDDPKLPAGQVDLVLLVDVYHEFSHPESMLWSIRQSLKPDGVIALLEYRAEDPAVPIKPLHKMSKAQIMQEYKASDLKLVREYNGLPWQHLMFFARDDSPLPEIEPEPFTQE